MHLHNDAAGTVCGGAGDDDELSDCGDFSCDQVTCAMMRKAVISGI